MKRFIFLSNKGSSFSPTGYEVKNDHYLGESYGYTAKQAFDELCKGNPDFEKQGYTFGNCWAAILHDNMIAQNLGDILIKCLEDVHKQNFERLTDNLNQLDMLRQELTGKFTVTTVCRADLRQRGHIGEVSNETMFSIASRIEDSIIDDSFWDALDESCAEHEVVNQERIILDKYRAYRTTHVEEPLLAWVDIQVEGKVERDLVALQSYDFGDDVRDGQVYYYFENLNHLLQGLREPFADSIIVNPENITFDNWANEK